jgi:uncharacterized protein involved in exopolysaccharide biosynthesis
MHVVFKRKRLIFLFFILVFCVVGWFTFVLDPVYEASAEILVKIGREDIYTPISGVSGGDRPILSTNSTEQINSEVELLQSPLLMEKVLNTVGPAIIYPEFVHTGPDRLERIKTYFRRQDSLSLHESAVLEFEKALSIKSLNNSRVIQIGFRHKDPQIAARIVEVLVSTYLEMRPRVYQDPKSYEFFKEQSQKLKAQMKQTEYALQSVKEAHNFVDLGEERSLLFKQIADQQTALSQSMSNKVENQKRISRLKKQLEQASETIPIYEEIDHNPLLINTLKARLMELELRQKELRSKYTPGSRMVEEVEEEILHLRDTLAVEESKRHGLTRLGINPMHQQLKEDLFRNQVESEALNAKISSQKSQLDEYEKKLQKFNQAEQRLKELNNQLDMDSRNYQLYMAKFEESRITAEMDAQKIASVSIISPARPPLKPIFPNVLLNIGLGFCLALFGSIMLAFFLDYLNDSIERPEDVEGYLQAPVMISIPRIRRINKLLLG